VPSLSHLYQLIKVLRSFKLLRVLICSCCCTAGSYGSTKRYKSFERLRKVNEQTIIGAGGELSDFQYILTLLDELSNEDFCADDDAKLSPKEIYAYLSRVLYNRRSKCVSPHNEHVSSNLTAQRVGGPVLKVTWGKCCSDRMDPLWNSLVVGGLQDGKPFLGTITMLGVHYSDDHIATGSSLSRYCKACVLCVPALHKVNAVPTDGQKKLSWLCIFAGFGQMLARPLFRERHRPDMSEEEAMQLLHEGLRVRAMSRPRFAKLHCNLDIAMAA
jgi:20S proteasome subunit beta 7